MPPLPGPMLDSRKKRGTLLKNTHTFSALRKFATQVSCRKTFRPREVAITAAYLGGGIKIIPTSQKMCLEGRCEPDPQE